MHRNAISHSRLMRESTDRIESALHSDDSKEKLVAHRLSENPATWQLWENEHSGLMRKLPNSAFCGSRPRRSGKPVFA